MIGVAASWFAAVSVFGLCCIAVKKLYESPEWLGKIELIGFFVSVSIWIVSTAIEMSVPAGNQVDGLAIKWSLIGEAFMSPFLLLFTYRYLTGRGLSLLSRFLFLLIPLLTSSFVLTNQSHGLVWMSVREVTLYGMSHTRLQMGIWGYIHDIIDYTLYLMVGLFFVVAGSRVKAYSKQLLIVGGAVILSIFSNLLYTLEIVPIPISPYGVFASGVFFVFGLYRTNLYTVSPSATIFGWRESGEKVSSGIITTGPDSHITDINTPASDMLEVSKKDVIGVKLKELIDCDTFPHEMKQDKSVYRVQRNTLYNNNEKKLGNTYTIEDITTLKQKKEQLRVTNRLLRHNLRNELSVLSMNAECLNDLNYTSTNQLQSGQEPVQNIRESVENLRRLSRSAQSLDSLVDEKSSMREAPLIDVVDSIEKTLQRRYSDITIKTDISPVTVIKTTSDFYDGLEQVIENVFEHTECETAHVSSSIHPETVAITVSDSGPGIRDYEIEAFRQKDETSLRHTSGIGLWIADWATRNSNGKMEIKSDTSGTTVRFTVPRGEIKNLSQ